MEEMDKFETKIKNVRELIIDTIKLDYDKLINNLNIAQRTWNKKNKENRNKTRENKTNKSNSW